MSRNTSSSRRRFIKLGAVSVAAVPLANLAFGRIAWSEELPHVEESDPQAQGLGYVHDASQVDKTRYTKYAEGQLCANCQLYMQPKEGQEWGPCAIFPGKAVNVNGWCSAWVARAG
jgi:hypothetical protein